VGGLLDRIAGASRRDAPLPRHATLAIEHARASKRPTELLSIVQATRGRVATVSRLRRGALIVATLAPLVGLSLVVWLSIRQAVKSDQAGFVVAGLTSFVADSVRSVPDTALAANPTSRARMNGALRSLGLLSETVRDTTTPIDTLRRQRRLAEAYMATALRIRARDTVMTTVFGSSTRDKRRRVAILARNRVVDSVTAREARILVDSVWKGRVPGNSDTDALTMIPLTMAVFSLFFGAIAAVLVGVFVRRGPFLRGFQLEIVTADGAPASRWRLLARNILNWSALVGCVVVLMLAQVLAATALAQAMVICAVIVLVWWLVAIVMSMRSPSRGLAERMSGTFLVLE
ncbi:MAG: hypothetical protein ABMA00_20985, partial [Gemmatimonas sp.]